MLQGATALKQRADYTHKYNAKTGRYGWLRLTPAYSVKIVNEIIDSYPQSKRILDPFCGSGTTALSAAARGIDAVTTDINPFLIWISRAKTRNYTASDIQMAEAVADILDLTSDPASPPPIHNIERWWGEGALSFLCRAKAALCEIEAASEAAADLHKVAFC